MSNFQAKPQPAPQSSALQVSSGVLLISNLVPSAIGLCCFVSLLNPTEADCLLTELIGFLFSLITLVVVVVCGLISLVTATLGFMTAAADISSEPMTPTNAPNPKTPSVIFLVAHSAIIASWLMVHFFCCISSIQ